MGVKATLIIFPSTKAQVIFNTFPTSGILADAVSQEAPAEFSDLVTNLETDSITDYETDFEAEASLVLDSTLEGTKIGVIIFEPVEIY